MNIMHLKYAVEVAKTGSITQAAEILFMGLLLFSSLRGTLCLDRKLLGSLRIFRSFINIVLKKPAFFSRRLKIICSF